MKQPVRWAVLVISKDGRACLLRRGSVKGGPPALFDKKTAEINAEQLRDNIGDEVTAVAAVRMPLILR